MYKMYRFMQMRAKILTCFSVAELECTPYTLDPDLNRPPNMAGVVGRQRESRQGRREGQRMRKG